MEHLKIQTIQNARFFQGLCADTCAALADVCSSRELPKKSILFMEDSKGSSIFLLAEGKIQLHKATPDGNEVVIRTIGPGEVFAEVVLFEQDRYPVTATAMVKSVVFAFGKSDILRLLDRPEFRNDFIASLMSKQRYLAERVRYLTSYDVEQRFFVFIEEHYGGESVIDVDMSKRDLAAAIGTTPETLSRLTSRLQDEGKITWIGKKLTVVHWPVA